MNQVAVIESRTIFTSTVGLYDKGPFNSFKEALKDFMERLKAARLPISLLETACWIERESNGLKYPLSFYNARDFGYKTGLLVGNGDFNLEAPEPDPVLVADLYHAASLAGGDAQGFIDALASHSPTAAAA